MLRQGTLTGDDYKKHFNDYQFESHSLRDPIGLTVTLIDARAPQASSVTRCAVGFSGLPDV